jgi:hypothetical protein
MIRKIKTNNCCANCKHLTWGKNEGWDYCSAQQKSIYWPKKKILVCEHYSRCDGTEDPRKNTGRKDA